MTHEAAWRSQVYDDITLTRRFLVWDLAHGTRVTNVETLYSMTLSVAETVLDDKMINESFIRNIRG
jgi:hypothetical protein